jgi:DNA-binding MarR family transcriptional regulator
MNSFLGLSQIWQLLHSILKEATPGLRKLGLDTREFLLLSKLQEFPHPAQLAEELFLPASTITLLTKTLEKQEIILRCTDKADLRRFRFEITVKGAGLLKDAKRIVEEIMGRRVDKLSPNQLKQLRTLIDLLTDRS